VGLQDCGRCETISYCGTECQRADWKKHKSVCLGRIARGFAKKKGLGIGREEPVENPFHTVIPADIKRKCDYLDERDRRRAAGKPVFGRYKQIDEKGWEGPSTTLRLEKLCEHIESLEWSKFEFYYAVKFIIGERPTGGAPRELSLTVEENRLAVEYAELRSICLKVGLSKGDARRAVDIVGHWRVVAKSFRETDDW